MEWTQILWLAVGCGEIGEFVMAWNCYCSSQLHGVAQTLTLNGNITWRYPSASMHFTSPSQETCFTDFGYSLPLNMWCHEFITLCWYFMIEHSKWKCHHICIIWMSFKFTCEILINKFKIHSLQVHLWNLIKHHEIPLCVNISVSSYKFCCGIPEFL
jgi:hypothetical protein